MKLTPTMMNGLSKMARKLERQSATLAKPDQNTGRALEKRGLIERVEERGGWIYYRLTDAGRTTLAERNEG